MGPVSTGDLEKELRSMVAEILEIDQEKILPDARFVEDLGMDSMMALEILATAEKKYGLKIPEENLTKVTTLKSMVEIVTRIKENN